MRVYYTFFQDLPTSTEASLICASEETSTDVDSMLHCSNSSGSSNQHNAGFSYCIFFIMSHALVDGIGISNIIADYFTTICQKLNLRQQGKAHQLARFTLYVMRL